MEFTLERIDRLAKEIKGLIYTQTVNVSNIKKKGGFFHDINEVETAKTPWANFEQDERWGGDGVYAWFRSEFIVPENMSNKKLVLKTETGASGWDAINPQFLVFVNGELQQGLDVNHKELTLTKNSKSGEKFIIDLQAYGGAASREDVIGTVEMKQFIAVLEPSIEKLYYDIFVPLEVAKTMDKDDTRRIEIEDFLETAVNILDLRKPYCTEFYSSVEDCLSYLQYEFYENYCKKDKIVAQCVGHTHIDVAWLWDLDQTRQKVQRSFATVLNLMEDYPEYIFMSSQPQLYKYLKKERPKLYDKVNEKVKEGRWEAEGAMWVEADCNVSSGEALIRQVIYGKRFFREEFGVENKILWLPDVFGYSSALPQILKKSGVDYFMTTKISWSEYNMMPYDTFMWSGLDGTEVLTHFITTLDYKDLPEKYVTTYNGTIDAPSVKGSWDRYLQKKINSEVLISFGYGDGGGGPTKEMLETARRMEKGIPGCPTTKMGTALDYFENLEKNVGENTKLPKWVGELYLEFHRGTLTSMARNKRYNRKSEFLYEEIEALSFMAERLGNYRYPKELIYEGWETICLNQFHDILPGSSIKKVYEDSRDQYEKIIGIGEAIKKDAISEILSNVEVVSQSVAVFNPSPFKRDELVTVKYDGEDIEFMARDIPANGFRLYPIDEICKIEKEIQVSKSCLENKYFKITLDDGANITSIYDKRCQREVIKPGQKANVFQAFEDKPHMHDAWDINIYYKQKMWDIDEAVSVEVVGDSLYKGQLKITRKFVDSKITQTMSIYRDIPRIDFDTSIDWKEKQVLLKVGFPVDVHTEKATYDIQLGNLERPTHWNTSWDKAKFEVCGHKWADVSEEGYGVSLINDCKYAYDIKDSNIRLTLIKSAISPNEDADREMHKFTYSLYPHIGDWRDGGTVQMGYFFNQPINAVVLEPKRGKLSGGMSFASADCENVVIEVIKKAEYENAMIIRAHECYNKRTTAKISLPIEIENVYECNMEEINVLRKIETADGSFSFTINPYEIKTFKIE